MPSVQIAPDAVGRAPAIARSRVLLPEPLWPITPIDSPWPGDEGDAADGLDHVDRADVAAEPCARRPPYVL